MWDKFNRLLNKGLSRAQAAGPGKASDVESPTGIALVEMLRFMRLSERSEGSD
jgi:hypothetical protein